MCLVEGDQSIAATARALGVVNQTLFNWIKAMREGKLTGVNSKPVNEVKYAFIQFHRRV